MKRLLFFLLSSFIPLLSNAQSTKTIELTFSEDEFVFELVGNGYEINSPIHNISFDSDSLKPALPYIGVNILLDANKEYDSSTFSISDSLIRENFVLNANQAQGHFSNMTDSSFTAISYPSGYYPSVAIEQSGLFTIGGYRCVSFLISPFGYNANTCKLYLNKNISITINQRNSTHPTYCAPSLQGPIQNIITNNVDTLYESILYPTNYEYIIITDSLQEPAYRNLVEWKTAKGIRSKVLTTEAISREYEGNTLPLKIKAAIKDYYDGCQYGLKYVLLGGDIDIVPTQMCYVKYVNSTDTTPTDWFYGCLDDIDWDRNGNGIWGEKEDSIDIAADVIISRLPSNNIEEAYTMISRILNYESSPSLGNWSDNIFTCGMKVNYNLHINNRIVSDAQRFGDNLYKDIIQNNWDGYQIRLYDTDSDFEGGSEYGFTAPHLQEEISKGYTFVNLYSHGSELSFTTEPTTDDPYYGHWYAQELINLGNSIITTQSCATNAFDMDQCLSELFMCNSSSGILAYLGCSRSSWPFTTGQFTRNFFKSLFNGGNKRLGEALFEAKNSFLTYCQNEGRADRWTLYTLNLLGDPEMPIFLSCPQKFNNVNISYVNENIVINTGTENSKICIMSANDLGENYYEIRDSVNIAAFDSIPDNISICITKTGYIPYRIFFNKTRYIQNETFSGNNTIYAGDTFIGRNVTAQKPEGSVCIEGGKTIIKSFKGVTIKNNFEVKNGASFEINTGN